MSARWWDYKRGIPSMGHVTSGGQWHPGRGDTCPRCNPRQENR